MTAAELAQLNQSQDPAQSVLARTYGWTPDEVKTLWSRGITPASLGQMTFDPNTLQILRGLISQLNATGAGTPTQPGPAQGSWNSYWGGTPQINMGGQPGAMATGAGTAGAGTASAGGGGGTTMASTNAEQIPTTVSIPQWQQWYNRNIGKTMLVNGQPVVINSDIGPDQLLQAFQANKIGWGGGDQGAQAPSAQIGGAGSMQPEQIGLQQMAQIDPVSEALRQGLGASYLSTLGETATPSAAQFQSYLDVARQVDPTTAAARQQLGSDLAAQEALGTQLDPATQREVEQATRTAQAARGNVYGTPQLVQEAMTRGQAGLALQQQRQQALQSYLQSGQTTGDVAMNLYNQRMNQLRASQGAALGYLGSGQTPYQAGASYYDRAQQAAANAAMGGPTYNPAALGAGLTGTAQQFPQYGLDMSQLAGNWYNNINQANLQAYGYQQAYGSKGGSGMGAATGALGGAASGALAGSALGPWGTVIGGLGGALAGGLSGYSK